MPSFDVVSEINEHELNNAIDQANRDIDARYDFKGAEARVERSEWELTLHAKIEFQIEQMSTILYQKLAKRGIDIRSLKVDEVKTANLKASQKITVRHGIESELAKKIVKLIKDSKMKVQAQIQGEQVRVTGKKRDDLQEAIAMLRATDQIDMPLQFTNFRD